LEFWRSGVRQNADFLEAQSQPRSAERSYDAVIATAKAIREGKIVAVKGIGGFQLIVDARNEAAVKRLRERKQREEKPFALMFPSLESVKAECEVSPLEERLLRSAECPIVLLRRLSTLNSQVSTSIAPGNPHLGVMLPYTPLHHLLLAELGFPVVATSGNLSDEPICTDERDALERLHDLADVFLVHNRPIVRHVDDSIVRIMLDRELVLRRARGYAPLPIILNPRLSTLDSRPILAVGAHLKNTVALSVGNQVFISQHIGDLETEPANHAFRRVIADFEKLYEAKPQVIAADLHPDYLSTTYALERRAPARLESTARNQAETVLAVPQIVRVQHHIAHVLSCMAENELSPPALGVSWDGTGYGTDGTIWGGEFFLVTDKTVERAAHLRPFRLPGGERAVKEPRRVALGLLFEIFGDSVFERKDLAPVAAFSKTELAALKTMLAKQLNSPVTTSLGRLFDAVASLVNLRQQMRFEGQAAMELEFALDGVNTDEAYPMRIAECGMRSPAGEDARPATAPNSELRTPNSKISLDWSPMIEAILSDVQKGVATGRISAKFHNALAEVVVAVAERIGERRVVLSGGCFQNRYLTERTVRRLQAEGFQPYWHQRVPTNDGGIALGQIVAAVRGQHEIVKRKS
jgi:hydrogenase maturation protein HypF